MTTVANMDDNRSDAVPEPASEPASEPVSSPFFALLSRMRYIDRWALMRSSRPENIAEHSLEVALIAHALATLANTRYGRRLDAGKAALIALYHDSSEIVTGDMPTPVKYANGEILGAYHEVEAHAEDRLLDTLPPDLRPTFEAIYRPDGTPEDAYLRRLVKAADKLSALIKCINESRAGNSEFASAEITTRRAVDKMADELPEVADFVREFLPPYGSTLDELLSH